MERVHYQQQEQMMRRQLEEQGLVISNQQKIIQEQLEYIRKLQEQQQALICECQRAGLNVSDITSFQPPSTLAQQQQQPQGTSNTSPQQLPPQGPAPRMPYPTHTPPPPPSHALTLSQPPPSSPTQVISPAMSKPHPPAYTSHSSLHRPPPHPPHLPHGHHLVASTMCRPSLLPHGPVLGGHPYSHGVPSSQSSIGQLTTSTAQISHSQVSPMGPHQTVYSTTDTQRTISFMEGLTFSPLTSGEFREIDQKPPGYSTLLMRTYDEELNNILDIAGLPTGSGAGYGVGVADDELPALDLRYVEIKHIFVMYTLSILLRFPPHLTVIWVPMLLLLLHRLPSFRTGWTSTSWTRMTWMLCRRSWKLEHRTPSCMPWMTINDHSNQNPFLHIALCSVCLLIDFV